TWNWSIFHAGYRSFSAKIWSTCLSAARRKNRRVQPLVVASPRASRAISRKRNRCLPEEERPTSRGLRRRLELAIDRPCSGPQQGKKRYVQYRPQSLCSLNPTPPIQGPNTVGWSVGKIEPTRFELGPSLTHRGSRDRPPLARGTPWCSGEG